MNKTKFKKTEIGLIPEDWEVKCLGSEIYIIGGGTPKTTNPDYWSGSIPWISVTDFGNGRWIYRTEKHITEKGLNESSTKILHQGQIIISARGTVGEVRQIGSDMAFNQSCYGIDGKQIINNNYLYSLLKYKVIELQKQGHGAVFNTITRNTFNNIFVALPNHQEQSAIAKILSDLDYKIEVLQRQNEILEAIGQAIFKHWFVDFEFPDENGKPYKSSGGEMVDSEFGEIPKGWGISKLEDYGTFKNGINYLRGETGDTVFFIANVRDIANNKLLLKCSLDNIKLNMNKAQDYLLKDKDILIARSASPGKVSLVLGDLDKLIYSGFSIRYRLNNPNNYLYIFLILQGLKESLSNFAVGTTLQSINQETLKNMKFILPSDKILHEFSKVVGLIFIRTYNNLIQSQNLSQIRDSLLPILMSGRIRVPVEVNKYG